MSGFEIAGLVLGAFPLLCKAGTEVGHACKHFKTWWRFEREFEKFLWAVEREQIAFLQNIEIFLSPLENLTAHDRQHLQTSLDSALWHLPRIRKELRRGIQEAYYGWFIRQLVDINDALNQLHGLLPIFESSPDTKALESHVYRLRHSFFPRKDELLALITEKNQSIYMFFSRASLTSTGPHRPDRRKVKAFLESSRDPANIRLLSTYSRTQLRVEVETIPESEHIVPQSQNTKHTDITALRQQLTLRSKLKELKDKSTKGISVLATSAISRTSPPGVEITPKEKKQKYRKLSGFRDRLRTSNESLPVTSESPIYLTPQIETEPPLLPQVRFEDGQLPNPAPTTVTATTTERDMTKIINFCQTIMNRFFYTETYRGFLQIATTNRNPPSPEYRVLFHLDPTDQNALGYYREQDLQTFIRTSPRRDARMRVGLSIILNTLNLGRTPMIPTLWTKQDVFVYRHCYDGSISQPYLKSHYSPKTTTSGNRHIHPTSPSQSLSDHNSTNREETTVSDTKQARHILFTLGIILIELLFGDHSLDTRPASTDDDYTSTELLCAVLTWQRRAEEEFGDGIAEAIRKCLVCAFEPAADLGSAAFVLTVWANVVQPLEEFLKAWGGGGVDVDV